MFRIVVALAGVWLANAQCNMTAVNATIANITRPAGVATNNDTCNTYNNAALDAFVSAGGAGCCSGNEPNWNSLRAPYIGKCNITCNNAILAAASSCVTALGSIGTTNAACNAYWNNYTACWTTCAADAGYNSSIPTAGRAACPAPVTQKSSGHTMEIALSMVFGLIAFAY